MVWAEQFPDPTIKTSIKKIDFVKEMAKVSGATLAISEVGYTAFVAVLVAHLEQGHRVRIPTLGEFKTEFFPSRVIELKKGDLGVMLTVPRYKLKFKPTVEINRGIKAIPKPEIDRFDTGI